MSTATTTASMLDDKALRKAWLKQRFGSFAYHEELLALHEQFKNLIKRALDRPEVRRYHPEDFSYFNRVVLPNLGGVPAPGQTIPDRWQPGLSRGYADNIHAYSTYISGDVYWNWMTPSEEQELGRIWGPMDRMCQNIQYTVDKYWFNPRKGNDDILLDETYTGPIDWPANWREQVLGSEGAALAGEGALRVKAGEPVPETGTYVALDPRDRRFTVKAGDTLPDLGSAYGITIWQKTGD